MEHVAVDLQPRFAAKNRTAAMYAFQSESDGRSRPPTTDAPVSALEARRREKCVGDLAHLSETHRAREREAGLTQRLAGSVEK
jgi:hypothetical protein